jgi:hypothetical protein
MSDKGAVERSSRGGEVARDAIFRYGPLWPVGTAIAWLERIDSGTHRRIKGLRLVTAFGIAWMMANLQGLSIQPSGRGSLGAMAAGFALWASVSEGRTTRAASSRDLALLVLAAVIGAIMMLGLAPVLAAIGRAGPELTLVTGAFLVGYLKRFGVLGAGLGSQIYIGQLLAYGTGSTPDDLAMVAIAGLIAAVAAIIPRLLSGPAEHPALAAPAISDPETDRAHLSPELRMGLQAASAALVIVILNDLVGLKESAWAITACTYVIAGTTSGTIDRVFRRIIGTAIGVPLGLACLPFALQFPLVIWIAAALAMIIYAMALPDRYDIACGAYAFALVLTLAASGESSVSTLLSRAWETLIGGALGLTTAMLVFPLRAPRAH